MGNESMPTQTVMMQEDEIDLRELAATIGRYKYKLALGTLVVSLLAVLYVISLPNTYKATIVLMPQAQQGGASKLGGLASLVGLAGIDLGGSSMGPAEGYQVLLGNYQFMRQFILEHNLLARYRSSHADQNYRFALGIRSVYEWKKGSAGSRDLNNTEEELFSLTKELADSIKIEKDKQTGAITLACSDSDPVRAKEVIDLFLAHATRELRAIDMRALEKSLQYYQAEIERQNDLAIKNQVSQLMSAMIQTKVQAQANEYYNVKVITPSFVAYEKDKTGPKRGLIVVVATITSLILGIFSIFLWEFIRKNDEEG